MTAPTRTRGVAAPRCHAAEGRLGEGDPLLGLGRPQPRRRFPGAGGTRRGRRAAALRDPPALRQYSPGRQQQLRAGQCLERRHPGQRRRRAEPAAGAGPLRHPRLPGDRRVQRSPDRRPRRLRPAADRHALGVLGHHAARCRDRRVRASGRNAAGRGVRARSNTPAKRRPPGSTDAGSTTWSRWVPICRPPTRWR